MKFILFSRVSSNAEKYGIINITFIKFSLQAEVVTPISGKKKMFDQQGKVFLFCFVFVFLFSKNQ